tara:strand:+ start:1712 stop:2533 length:822 start_codon:yes stop_codon:yes gene_type:complete
MIIKKLLYKLLNLINKNNTYYFSVRRYDKTILKNRHDPSKINLNVGSGGYNIDGFRDLDYLSEKYDKERAQTFIPYDMRNDKIPFEDETVDNIYCSHVIEHIEEIHVKKFLEESSRVLKKDGVLRISTPDSKFLWNMLLKGKRYWEIDRYYNWFLSRGSSRDECDELDFFIREIATAKLKVFSEKNKKYYDEVRKNIKDYKKVLNILGNNKFDTNNIGDHITSWDFEKIYNLSKELFTDVIESRHRGSISNDMRSEVFDRTCPEMSLYVDFRK